MQAIKIRNQITQKEPSAIQSTWFQNLTALRFFAAAMVVTDHIEQARNMFGFDNFWKQPAVYALGDKAVTLFFVLSGFLITYLLLKEKSNSGTVSIKDFYVRRILRIWPLYFLIALTALFFVPLFPFFNWPEWSAQLHVDFGIKTLLFLLILPNASQVLFTPVPFANQLWSIGVEEQFYLFWPLILKYVKKISLILLLIVIGMPMATGFLYYLGNNRIHGHAGLLSIVNFLKQFLALTRIDCMAIGGLGAICLYKQKDIILRVVFHPLTQVLNLAALLYIFATGFYLPFVSNLIHGLVFGILILNLAANPKRVFSLEYGPLNFLGKISYGIYMYHPLCIFLSIKILIAAGLDLDSVSSRVLLYAGAYGITITLAATSYRFFEAPLLRRKNRFSHVAIPVEA